MTLNEHTTRDVKQFRNRQTGFGLIVGSPLFVVVVYAGLNLWMKSAAEREPAPNQSIMALAFIALICCSVIAIVTFILGIVLIVKNR